MAIWLPRTKKPWFPPIDEVADEDGLVAGGGDLAPARLLLAYESGIFPWYEEGVPPLWWSPDPRTVITAESLHVSRRLARTLRSGRFRATWNTAFVDVIRGCASGRGEGTWLIPEMITAYERLHGLGHAHSLEIWTDGDADGAGVTAPVLAGGLYGVQRGALFAAESMFHRVTDASKAAVVCAVRSLTAAGIEVFDVQMTTDHLLSLGAVEVPRSEYLASVAAASRKSVDLRAPSLTFGV